MTFGVEIPKSGPYVCDGNQTEWDYDFTLPDGDTDDTYLKIYVTDSNGVETEVTTNFSVDTSSKVVTYPIPNTIDPLTSDYTIELRLEEPLSNTYDPTAYPFDAAGLGEQLDKTVRLLQQMGLQISGGSGGGGTWGSITGTLADQTDLNSALSGKAAVSHSHTGLVTNGNSHAHNGFDGAFINYNTLTNKPLSFTPSAHTHIVDKLEVINTHQSPDTDSGPFALHHTIGTGVYQAAAGNHNHLGDYSPVNHNHSGVYALFSNGVDGGSAHTHDGSQTAQIPYANLKNIPASFQPSNHTHTVDKLLQSNTHQSPDTDSSPLALHHSIGTGAYQAAAGNHDHGLLYSLDGHTHTGVYSPVNHNHSGVYAPVGNGVTSGDSHNHTVGSGGAQIPYSSLSGIPVVFAPSSHYHQTINSVSSGSVYSKVSSETLVDGQSAELYVKVDTRYSSLGIYKHAGASYPAPYIRLDQSNGTVRFMWFDDTGKLRHSSTFNHVGTTNGSVIGDLSGAHTHIVINDTPVYNVVRASIENNDQTPGVDRKAYLNCSVGGYYNTTFGIWSNNGNYSGFIGLSQPNSVERYLWFDDSGNLRTSTFVQAVGTTGGGIVGGAGGTGDVVGPSSSTDNAIARYDSTTGKLIQNSLVTVDDNGTINIPSGQSYKINGTALSSANVNAQALHGFENRTSSTIAMNGSNFEITTGTNYNVYANGTKINKTTTQSVAISTDLTQHYIYYTDSGTLSVSTSPWDILSNNVPVATVYKDGSNYSVGEERHGILKDRGIHYAHHMAFGALYGSGSIGTFTNTTLSMSQGLMFDEDIPNDTGGTKTTCTLVYRNAGLTASRIVPNTSTPYSVNTGALQYDNAGTLASVDASKYVINDVYHTNDINYPYFVVVGQNQHLTTTAASNSALATVYGFSTREWRLVYRVIYRNVGGTPTYISATPMHTTGQVSSANISPTDHNTLINRDAASSHPVTAISGMNSTLFFVINGGGSVPATGAYCLLPAPYACTIDSWYIAADASGSAVVDIKVGGSSIVGGSGNKPTLSSAQTNSANVSSWSDTSIAQNDLFTVNLDSVTTCKIIHVQLRVTRV
jgi:hypothetical protein